jgi:F-type H+-transporting ATPase subunit epsilon
MKTFALDLCDSMQTTHFPAVTELVAADGSGAFGIRAGHARFVAALRYGLLRFSTADGTIRYAALPGGILRFADDRLEIVSARFFLGDERSGLVQKMTQELAREDSDVRQSRLALARIEQTLMRHLGELAGRTGSAA